MTKTQPTPTATPPTEQATTPPESGTDGQAGAHAFTTPVGHGTGMTDAPQSAPAQGEPTETVMRNALCRVYEIINGSDDFDADEVNAIIKAATGKFPISREWSMGAAYKEELTTLRQQLAQMEEERDQARQDLEERCAENDRERAAHLQAYQAAEKERDEARKCWDSDNQVITILRRQLAAAESELAELRLDRDGSGLRNDLAITEGELKKYRDRLAFLGNPKNVFAYSVAADGQIKVGSRFDFKLFPSMEAAVDAARNQQENRE